MQENLKQKYDITDEELATAYSQISFSKIKCRTAILIALCDLLTSGDIPPGTAVPMES